MFNRTKSSYYAAVGTLTSGKKPREMKQTKPTNTLLENIVYSSLNCCHKLLVLYFANLTPFSISAFPAEVNKSLFSLTHHISEAFKISLKICNAYLIHRILDIFRVLYIIGIISLKKTL